MNLFCFALFLCLVTSGLTARDFEDNFREWRSANGEHFVGKLKSVRDHMVILEGTDRERIQVPVNAFDPREIVFINRFLRSKGDPEYAHPEAKVTPQQRFAMPSVDQGAFGRNSNDETCGPNACINFLLWWADLGLIALEREDSRTEQCDNLHRDLDHYMSSDDGTDFASMQEGLAEYFEKNPSPFFEIEMESVDFTFEAASSACEGSNMVVLSLETMEKSRPEEGHWVSLVSCDRQGNVILNTWGSRFFGRVVPGVYDGEPVQWIELIDDPGQRHSEWINEGGGFVIRPPRGSMLVVKLVEREQTARAR
ncbi:MAG: hypothetical protein ACFB21_02885 [Opitutales bacterium]